MQIEHVAQAITEAPRIIALAIVVAATTALLIVAARRLWHHYQDPAWQRGYNRGCQDSRAGRNRHFRRARSAWARGYSHGWYDQVLFHDRDDDCPF